jgi:hypothetical protein
VRRRRRSSTASGAALAAQTKAAPEAHEFVAGLGALPPRLLRLGGSAAACLPKTATPVYRQLCLSTCDEGPAVAAATSAAVPCCGCGCCGYCCGWRIWCMPCCTSTYYACLRVMKPLLLLRLLLLLVHLVCACLRLMRLLIAFLRAMQIQSFCQRAMKPLLLLQQHQHTRVCACCISINKALYMSGGDHLLFG